MADLHKEFVTFHDKIALSRSQKKSLRTSRNAIRERIKKYFREELDVKVPTFYMQGSYAMVTTINSLDGEFDVDTVFTFSTWMSKTIRNGPLLLKCISG